MLTKTRFVRLVTALMLAVLVCGLLPVQVFAEAQPEYISEMRIGNASDEKDAYQSLVDAGFTVMTYNTNYTNGDVNKKFKTYADLNQGGSSKAYGFRKGSSVVYLGYKTTKNKDEAITDIVAMEMNGNYSFVDYQNLLSQMKDTQLLPFIAKFAATLREYRKNYSSKNTLLQAKAQYVHDVLNHFREDDSGKLLGDLLLNETKEEIGESNYFFLSASEKENHADLCKILLQGSQLLVPQLKLLIASAADTAENTWIDRLAALTEQDLIRETAEKTGATQSDVMAALSDEYGAAAQELGGKWEDFRAQLLQYMAENNIEIAAAAEEPAPQENEDLPEEGEDLPDEGEDLPDESKESETKSNGYVSLSDMSEEELTKTLDVNSELELSENADESEVEAAVENYAEKTQNLKLRFVYETLQATPYDGGTLVDYFLRPLEDVSGDRISALYPLAAALSEGQRGALEAVSLLDLMQFAISAQGYGQTDYSVDELFGDEKEFSVYAGVDRSVFSGGAALTQDALRKDPEAVLSFWGWFNSDKLTQNVFKVAVGISAFGLLLMVVGGLMVRHADHLIATTTVDPNHAGSIIGPMCDLRDSGKIYMYQGLGIISVAVLVNLVLLLAKLNSYYSPEFKPIPQHLINERDIYETDANGKQKLKLNAYAFYDAVECNRTKKSEDWENLKTYGDLNGDVGRQWIALYTTKNPEIGEPILASSLKTVVGKTDLPAGYEEGLKLSGAKAFLNLTDDHYTYNNETGGIYLYWQRPASTSIGGQASAMNSGTLAIAAGGGFFAGGALGMCVMSIVKKKKKL